MSEYERWDEDVEVVDNEKEPVESDTKLVTTDVELAEDDVEVVGRVEGDSVLEYVYGLTDKLPRTTNLAYLLTEYKRTLFFTEEAKRHGLIARAKEYRRRLAQLAMLIFSTCTFKRSPHCPVYGLASKCPLAPKLEKHCRKYVMRRLKKVRRWFRE